MRVLLDECLPRPLVAEFHGHEVTTVPDAGWAGRSNGDLLDLAEREFDVLATVDRGMEFQQNIGERQLAIIAFAALSNRVEDLRPLMPRALEALRSIKPGQFICVGA